MDHRVILTNHSLAVRDIYDQYAGMLLGYIYEVVKDKQTAEEYLISVFNELPGHLHNIVQPGFNTYHRLQLITRKVLADFFETIPACNPEEKNYLPAKPNKFLNRMSGEEQMIFCSIHYSGKSISTLATELQKPEEEIKRILQQALLQ